MGFFDIFKKKPKEYTLSEVKIWLQQKQAERAKKETSVKNALVKHTEQLIHELEEGLPVFLSADLSKHSVEERIKVIVKGNIKKYGFYIEQLIKELQKEKETAAEMLDHIQKSFLDFEQKSVKSFHKSTYLVGDELEPIKTAFKEYNKEIKDLREENEAVFDTRYDRIAQLITEIESKTNSPKEQEKQLAAKEKNIMSLREKLEETKKSNEYKERENAIQLRQKKQQEKNKKISELKEAMDFRHLAKTFHGEKKYEDVKHYKEDFSRVLQDPKPVFELMKLAHQDTTKAEKICQEIKKIEIPSIPTDPTITILEKIAAAEQELKKAKETVSKAHKSIEEQEQEKKQKMKLLKELLLEKKIQLNI